MPGGSAEGSGRRGRTRSAWSRRKRVSGNWCQGAGSREAEFKAAHARMSVLDHSPGIRDLTSDEKGTGLQEPTAPGSEAERPVLPEQKEGNKDAETRAHESGCMMQSLNPHLCSETPRSPKQ